MNIAQPKLLNEYVQSQRRTNTAKIVATMKEIFRDVIQTVREVEMDEDLGRERFQQPETSSTPRVTKTGIRRKRQRPSWAVYPRDRLQCYITQQICFSNHFVN